MGAGELDAHPGAAQSVDRLAVEALRRESVAQQRSRASLDAQSPVRATGASHLRKSLEGVFGPFRPPAPRGGLDELGQRPGGIMRVLAGLAGCGQLVPI